MKTKNVSRILFVIYFLFLCWLVLFKFSFSFEDIQRYRAINLDPFHDALNHPIRTREVIYNILIFIPYGILISIAKENKSILNRIFQIFLTSLVFETLQFVFMIGSSDVNDLITNTLGGVIGIVIYGIFKKVFGRNSVKIVNTLSIIFLIFAVIFIVILF